MKTLEFIDTGGLFDHFEVNREPFWPRIVWLVAGSGAWHLVLIACIVLIPPVRDAFAITALFAGAGFVDRPYSRTEIGDDVDIIDFTTEKFRYPEGYFLMDQQGMLPPQQFPVMPPFTPTSNYRGAYPSPSPTPSVTPVPTPGPGVIANNTGDGKTPETKPSPAKPDEKAVAQAQKDLEAASKKTGIELPEEGEINKAPFRDLAIFATELRDQKKLDLDKPFEVTIDTTLDKDGKLVNAMVSRKSGDETLVELGKRLVAAMNDSGVLFYLKKLNEDKPGTKVSFTIKQEASEVVAIVESEASSADSANKLSRGFALLMVAGAKSREGHDEEMLLKNTKVSADSNKVVFKLTLPREDAVEMVKKGMAIPSPTVTPG
jgi:hypothetical protein